MNTQIQPNMEVEVVNTTTATLAEVESSTPILQLDPYEAMGLEILREYLRQAQLKANISIAAIAGSLVISLVGGGLLLAGKVTEGTVTTTTGLFSSMCCTQAAKDANEQLERIAKELEALRSSDEE